MKTITTFKIIFVIACFYSIQVTAQSNTLPENGNVGIGTMTPSAKLDVNGNVHIDSMLMVKDSILIQKSARIKKDLTVEENLILPNLVENAEISVSKNIILFDKETEIVSSFETAKLNEFLYNQSCSGKIDEFGNVLSPTWMNNTNKIFIDCPQVNVGIATIEPKYNLDVRGSAYVQKFALGVLPGGNLDYDFQMKVALPQTLDRNIFVIENLNRKILQINNNGLIQAREIKLDAQNWPDYVFDKKYPLLPLKEVELFINKNKHLPSIPDAQTMESEGVNLAEMDKLLLLKIEELTLYLLEQNKMLEEQAARIKALEILLQK